MQVSSPRVVSKQTIIKMVTPSRHPHKRLPELPYRLYRGLVSRTSSWLLLLHMLMSHYMRPLYLFISNNNTGVCGYTWLLRLSHLQVGRDGDHQHLVTFSAHVAIAYSTASFTREGRRPLKAAAIPTSHTLLQEIWTRTKYLSLYFNNHFT